jgi:hypothetical protein
VALLFYSREFGCGFEAVDKQILKLFFQIFLQYVKAKKRASSLAAIAENITRRLSSFSSGEPLSSGQNSTAEQSAAATPQGKKKGKSSRKVIFAK